MGFLLLFIFIAVPIAELAIFIEVGSQFGLWLTLFFIILTAVIGAAFLRYQGLEILSRVKESVLRGRTIAHEMFDGICLLVTGVLLITPGFITDCIGFALLVAPIRRSIFYAIIANIIKSKRTTVWASSRGAPKQPQDLKPGSREGPIINGDFEDISSDPTKKNICG